MAGLADEVRLHPSTNKLTVPSYPGLEGLFGSRARLDVSFSANLKTDLSHSSRNGYGDEIGLVSSTQIYHCSRSSCVVVEARWSIVGETVSTQASESNQATSHLFHVQFCEISNCRPCNLELFVRLGSNSLTSPAEAISNIEKNSECPVCSGSLSAFN